MRCNTGNRFVYTTRKCIPHWSCPETQKKSAIDEFLINGRLFHILYSQTQGLPNISELITDISILRPITRETASSFIPEFTIFSIIDT